MFAVPGILLLLVFIYVRPLEFVPLLAGLPLLYLFFALALVGFALDLRLRRTRPQTTPQLPWVVLFAGWCLVTLLRRAPDQIAGEMLALSVAVVLYLVIGHGIQTFRALELVMGTLLALTLFLALVGVHQGFAPHGCHAMDPRNPSVGVYDGRSCETDLDCRHNDPEPGVDYMCERAGLFGTSTVGHGRVRYLGPLQDPNELALAIGIGLPFAFAFFARRRSSGRFLLLALALVLVATCIVFTQSRGGQLVFITAVGAYFVKRYGWKGMVAGAILGAPLLLLGGRSGAEAEASSIERLECWYEGMSMFKEYPLFGVGMGQFTDHHFLTAHNSFVLAPAELGFPGMVLWSAVLYVSIKIPVAVLRELSPERVGPEAQVARTWAMALLAAWAAALVGVFFLSFCYHQMLWIYIGLSAALYSCVKRHAPDWEVRFGFGDLARVIAIDGALIAMLFVYTRLKAP